MTLTQERLKELFSYNPETGVFLYETHRGSAIAGRVAGSTIFYRGKPYRKISINGKIYAAHRLAWFYMTGQWPEHDIDHINMDGQDNRFCNLRTATRSQNMANIRGRNPFKGVVKQSIRTWYAHITVKGKHHYLGMFPSPEAAHEAYSAAATKYFGEFARA